MKVEGLFEEGAKGAVARFDGKARAEAPPSSELATSALSVALWVKIDSFGQSLFPLEKSMWMQSGRYVKHYEPGDEFYTYIFKREARRMAASGLRCRWRQPLFICGWRQTSRGLFPPPR